MKLFFCRYIKGLVKQHKDNMLNNVQGYGWINRQFAEKFAMQIDEVNAYRVQIAHHLLRVSNATSLLKRINLETVMKCLEFESDEADEN